MSTLKSEKDSRTPTAADSTRHCQTDGKGRAGNYVQSRLNACSWQCRRENLLACMGSRCPYNFCGYREEEMPPRGTACAWEVAYAAMAAEQFDDLFPSDGIGKYLDDRSHWRREWTIAHLVANRASVRATTALKKCWSAITDRGCMPVDQKPFAEYDLARRYQTAARNRINAMWDQLPAIQEKAQLDRMRLQMIMHGYWKPHEDPDRPRLEDVPEWIERACSKA